MGEMKCVQVSLESLVGRGQLVSGRNNFKMDDKKDVDQICFSLE
jgi:hypothetical protein